MKSQPALVGRNLVLVLLFASIGQDALGATESAPVAWGNTYFSFEGIELVVAAPGVLENDKDADEDRMNAILDAPPSNGVLSLRSNGGFSYKPSPGFVGTDSFSYHAHDGAFSSNVTPVTIHVVASPLASMINGSFEKEQLNMPAGWKVEGNLSRSGGAPGASHGYHRIEFNDGNRVPNGKISQVVRTEPGQKYTLSFDAGVLSYVAGQQRIGLLITDVATNGVTAVGTNLSETHTLTGSPGGGTTWFPGQITFTATGYFTEIGFSDQSSVTTNIDLLLDNVRLEKASSAGNGTPVATADAYSTPRNTSLAVTGAGVLANDTDPENNALVAVKTGNGPTHGSLTWGSNGSIHRGRIRVYAGCRVRRDRHILLLRHRRNLALGADNGDDHDQSRTQSHSIGKPRPLHG